MTRSRHSRLLLAAGFASAALIGHAADATPKAAAGGWTLAATDSRLAFVSIKNDAVGEVHRFPALGGTVDASGRLALEIALDAVETGVPIRNERMRTMLFDTAAHPTAKVSAQVDAAAVRALPVGASLSVATPVTLSLHGLSGELPGEFRITHVSAQQWRVSTEAPLIVNAATFGLGEGVEALRNLAKLQAISAAVPVTASLLFDLSGR